MASTSGEMVTEQRLLPTVKKPLEEEIHKLLQAVAVPRTCKSLDLPDRDRIFSKKPLKAVGSMSPVIGFSEQVSLKQALRGLCISQAAEMAAVKRLSMTASPRVSDTVKVSMEGKIRTGISRLSDGFTVKAAETVKEECVSVELAEESAAFCEGKPAMRRYQEPKVKSRVRKTHSTKSPSSASSSNVANKAATKVSRKPTPTSSVVKSSRAMKTSRNASRAAKTVVRNRYVVVRRSKKAVAPTCLEFSSDQLICQKCQCSLRIEDGDSTKTPKMPVAGTGKDPQLVFKYEKSQSVKQNFISKAVEKGDISHSSKSSSICEFSSSATSLSEESSRSGSSTANRPHMSMDLRWRAIECIRKKHGYLALSHFSLLKKLGSGDIGTVYLAKLIGTDSLFAIKVMDNEFLAKRQKIPRAETEGQILRMLDHPFLPTLYAQFTSDNLSCLVMEFCHGGDLHVLRQKQPAGYFAEDEARFYVAEILLALEYLHMLGIVYRDLKPENILVREDGHIMLTDFDLSLICSVNPCLLNSTMEPARVSVQCSGSNCIDPFCTGPSCKVSCFTPRIFSTNSKTRKMKGNIGEAGSLLQLVVEPKEARSNSFVGTHEYLAPEIIKGEGHGSAVDWWTFGVLLYELLYGRTPFKGSGNEETLSNIVLRSLEFPDAPLVSFQARDLIRRLLVKEPESRLGTETGAAEIKRHPFFEGMNWALIRCSVPPPVHEAYYDNGNVQNK